MNSFFFKSKRLLKSILLFFILINFNFLLAQTTFNYTGVVQNYTVPVCGTSIRIEAIGAGGVAGTGGGIPGKGTRMIGTFTVVPGSVLSVYVGGNPGAQAGGQGSYVSLGAVPFIVAGGGGGGGWNKDGGDALIVTSGSVSPNHAGGAAGTLGNGGIAGIGNWGTGGGAGFFSVGTNGIGSIGGALRCKASLGTTYAGGAGGGYSGGGGVDMDSGWGTGGGGGGGSYNNGTSQSNTAGFQVGSGTIIITQTVSISSYSFSIAQTTTISCNSYSNAILAANVTGGIGPFTYSWMPSGGTASVTTGLGAGTYTCKVTDACLNILTNTFTITQPASFSISATASSSVVCSGSPTTLSGAGASTYTWTGGITNAVPFTPLVTTTYSVSGTNALGCSASNIAVVTVTVFSASSVTVSPLTSTICLGQTANLIASGGLTYTWTASSGATPPSVANVTVSPLVNTTYTVLSGSGTCTTQAVSSVIVSPAFALVGAPNPTTICSGGLGVALTVSGATSYTWSGLGLSTTTGSIVTATPLVNTTYTIVGSNGSCSSATLITVNVTSVSTTVTASATSYCTGGLAVTLTGAGATTYSWSPAAGLSTTTGAVVSATPTISTVYTVVGTTGLCTSTKTISISVSTTSSLSIASTGTVICPGSSGVTLTGSGASTYTWLPGGTTVNPLLANPASTTVYTLTGTSAGGCISIPAVITVSVLPAINPVLSSSSASVCLTKTVTLSATPVGAGYSYTWSPAGAILGPVNGASIIAKPVSAASPVIYTLLISNGVCVETSTIALNVIVCSPPVSSFNTLTNDSICTGGCVTFNATSLGTPPLTYEWYFEGGTPAFSTLAAPEVCYFAAGNYSVALVTANPFGTDTIIKLNYINVADTPAVVRAFNDTLIKIGQVAPIYATGATYYQWSPNNGTIACPSCSNTVVQPTVTTQYIVIGSNSPYCKRQDTIIVQVDFTCGDFFVPNVFSPNADGLNDVVMVNGFCIGTFNLKIFSRWGEKVFETSEKSNGWDGTYKGKPMDTGVFIYKVDGITIDGKPFVIKGNITLLK